MSVTLPESGVPAQPLPRLSPESGFYWTAGGRGHLELMRCGECRRVMHPPTPICRHCRSLSVAPEPVSGRATVWSFTVVHKAFVKWMPAPYVVALVLPVEDESVALTTRLVGCNPDEVEIDMPVEVTFEQHGDIYLPLFRPVGPTDAR